MQKIVRYKSIVVVTIVAFLLQSFPLSYAIAGGDEIKVENIRFEPTKDQVIVYYDLVGPADKEYTVTLTLHREDMESFAVTPLSVTGDVGKGYFAGKNRKIVWDISMESLPGFDQKTFYFTVDAEVVSSGSNALVWIAGAALVGGGAAYFLLGKKSETSNPASTGFPVAPGRP